MTTHRIRSSSFGNRTSKSLHLSEISQTHSSYNLVSFFQLFIAFVSCIFLLVCILFWRFIFQKIKLYTLLIWSSSMYFLFLTLSLLVIHVMSLFMRRLFLFVKFFMILPKYDINLFILHQFLLSLLLRDEFQSFSLPTC